MVGIASFSSSTGGTSATSGMGFLGTGGCQGIGLSGVSGRSGVSAGVSGLGGTGLRSIGSGRGSELLIGSREGCGRFRRCGLSLWRSPASAGSAFDARIRGQNRRVLVDLKLGDLLLDLRLEFVGGTAKFVHELADLARDFRQLLGPKDDEGQEEQEDRFRKTHTGHHIAPVAKAAIGGIVVGS